MESELATIELRKIENRLVDIISCVVFKDLELCCFTELSICVATNLLWIQDNVTTMQRGCLYR